MNRFVSGLSYDDVSLIPRYSQLKSRSEVNLFVDFMGHSMLPIFSSPMDTVTGIEMMQAMTSVGGMGIHHRYCDFDTLDRAKWFGAIAVAPSMGVDTIKKMYDSFDGQKPWVFLDVAHGDSANCYEFAEKILPYADVVSGNICTVGAAKRYVSIGVNALRVGVGGGHACSTRVVAGVGFPTFSAIDEIRQWSNYEKVGVSIVADGGIRSSGDIVKALAIGADAVILGRMLASAKEAPGKRRNSKVLHYLPTEPTAPNTPDYVLEREKEFRGMASESALSEAGKELNVEGVSMWIKESGAVSSIIRDITNGMKAGYAYLGARNITELRQNALFTILTHNGQVEGLPKNG